MIVLAMGDGGRARRPRAARRRGGRLGDPDRDAARRAAPASRPSASSRRSSAAASRSRSACCCSRPIPRCTSAARSTACSPTSAARWATSPTRWSDGDPEPAERAQERPAALDVHMIARPPGAARAARDRALRAAARAARAASSSAIERSLPQIDYAARDTRVLARNALRFLRAGAVAPAGRCSRAVARPRRRGLGARRRLRRRPARRSRCAALALERGRRRPPSLAEDARDLRLAELVVQVRSVAVDLVRAAELGSAARPARRPAPTSCSP